MADMGANMGKAAWPKTPDGTTDWEVVFEDPQTGFIQLIAQSPSAETLRLTTTVVIDKLFTRRGNEHGSHTPQKPTGIHPQQTRRHCPKTSRRQRSAASNQRRPY